jgi:hypothetical protein
MSNSVIVKSDKKITKKASKSEDGSSVKKVVIKNVYAPSNVKEGKKVSKPKESKKEIKCTLDTFKKFSKSEENTSFEAKTLFDIEDFKF